jgi:hypothetical protein
LQRCHGSGCRDRSALAALNGCVSSVGSSSTKYASASADLVHEAALIVSDEFAPFYDAYRRWIGRGFSSAAPVP